MKSVTEFANYTLNQAVVKKNALVAEGKSGDEISQSLGQDFKLEGDKLKYFINAVEVASQNTDKLKRVLVVKLNEGEAAPNKATQFEDLHYVPEFFVDANRIVETKSKKGGRGGNRGGDSKKGSPWGLSPEEKAAKAGKGPKPKEEDSKKK